MRVHTLALILVLINGCSERGPGGYGDACTEIGCDDGYTIEIVGPGGDDSGDLLVDVSIAGATVEAACATTSMASFDGFTCGMGMILLAYTEEEVGLSVETVDGELGWEGTIMPGYEEVYPNGVDCPPVCLQGRETVELSDLPGGDEIDSIGEEEVCGTFMGARPSVAVDSLGQPHIVSDTGDPTLGAELRIYHKLAGQWHEEVLATASDPAVASEPSSIAEPHLEIDPLDRAWVSAHYFRSNVYEACGIGVFLVEDAAANPELAWFGKYNIGSVGWSNGNLACDPYHPDEAVVMTYDGEWGKADTTGSVFEQGQMYIGNSGEKVRFLIAPRDGQTGVWHGITGGWEPSPSAYQNSARDLAGQAIVVWAEYGAYPIQGDDMRHPGLGLDGVDPEVAYISAVYEPGLVINVFDGEQMVWPNTALPVVDASPSYIHRFGPQWAPAHGGGAFLAWSSAGRIKLLYVGPDGSMGDEVDVCDGTNASLVTDDRGDIHLAYVDGGMRYRKILTR